MSRSINHRFVIPSFRYSVIPLLIVLLLAGCQPRVATSFWRIGTPADSVRPGYAVLHEGKKVRHCYPVTEYTATPEEETYRAFHHHGVAVENERMAYRIYFDKKQTIDIYCKRKPQLELAQSYWYPNDSLLALGYGDDILRVSGTVGVGSVKYWDGKLHHFDNVTSRSQRIVSQSRTSATIEVSDHGLVLPVVIPESRNTVIPEPSPIDLSVRYTLKAGHRDLRCDVTVSANSQQPMANGQQPLSGLCTGVQSIPAKGPNPTANSQWLSEQLPNGILLASWGTDWPVNDSAKYAKETVGLAVFIPSPYADSIVQDKRNLLCLLNVQKTSEYRNSGIPSSRQNSQQPEMCHAHFYLTVCGATKENHPVASSATEWFAYLRRWAKKLK